MSTFKFKVNVWESERGWGKKLDRTEEFDTVEKAEDFLKEFNSQNKEETTPDWYMYAERDNYSI